MKKYEKNEMNAQPVEEHGKWWYYDDSLKILRTQRLYHIITIMKLIKIRAARNRKNKYVQCNPLWMIQ